MLFAANKPIPVTTESSIAQNVDCGFATNTPVREENNVQNVSPILLGNDTIKTKTYKEKIQLGGQTIGYETQETRIENLVVEKFVVLWQAQYSRISLLEDIAFQRYIKQ